MAKGTHDFLISVFDTITVARDMYTQKYRSAADKRKRSEKHLKENYRPNGQEFRRQKEKIENDFITEVAAVREECETAIKEAIDFERERAKQDVTAFEAKQLPTVTEIVKTLEGLPVTSDEIGILVETYGGSNYWCDRLISQLAKNKGIIDVALPPDLATKTACLDELERRAETFFDAVGKDDYRAIDALHDNHIARLEKRYTHDYAGLSLSSDVMAKAAVRSVYQQPDAMAKAAALTNTLKSTDDSVRELVLDKLVEDRKLDDVTLSLANARRLLDEHEEKMKEEQTKQNLLLARDMQPGIDTGDNAETAPAAAEDGGSGDDE